MKHSTEYLTGLPKSHFEPNLTIVANMRIQAGRDLMRELSKQRELPPHDDIVALITRYQAAEEMVAWWQRILDET